MRGFFISRSRKGGLSDVDDAGKTPDFWAHVWLIITTPVWQGAIMAATISLHRASEPRH